ncbi:hypothetical protein C444_08650 [Haloarcula japonica DSM 6131]|uniref:Uncharacterized protein n=1 Tax=Haloarcula japonica (strain ATCC 49778 / DSM 6131 / JCM 7785 / NBRC 101032 / NCIMB 13157 / TR-1) TaxID=1227453 RepID=M0LG53_HALJT|nr:hypothetical protein C444_08650 [Haloarcula japonica DSM 6131]
MLGNGIQYLFVSTTRDTLESGLIATLCHWISLFPSYDFSICFAYLVQVAFDSKFEISVVNF